MEAPFPAIVRPSESEPPSAMKADDDISIRAADAGFGRWQDVVDLVLEAFAYMSGRIDPPSSALRLTPAAVAEQALRGGLLIAERRGEPVGCAFLTPRDDVLYLGKLAVRPGLQGRGLGRRLVEAAWAEALRRDCRGLELQTRVELLENHRVFAALGFVETGRTAHPGYARPTSITMRREAAP